MKNLKKQSKDHAYIICIFDKVKGKQEHFACVFKKKKVDKTVELAAEAIKQSEPERPGSDFKIGVYETFEVSNLIDEIDCSWEAKKPEEGEVVDGSDA